MGTGKTNVTTGVPGDGVYKRARVFEPGGRPQCCASLDGTDEGSGGTWFHKREQSITLVRHTDVLSFLGLDTYRRYQPWISAMGIAASVGVWCVAIACGVEEWFRQAERLGLLGLDLSEFRKRAKAISTLAKNDQLPQDVPRHWFTELQSATGYLFEPDPSFDKVESARELLLKPSTASAEFRRLYYEFARRFTYTGGELPKLEEWVESAVWATSGGAAMSGLDKVEYSLGGKAGRLRMTKVVLLNATDAATVVERTVAAFGKQKSKAEVKSETAKLRNIYNYRVWNFIGLFWVLDQLKEKNFAGITSLGENFQEHFDRLKEMLALTSSFISLPLDWEGFDGQVETWQHIEAWRAFSAAVPGSKAVAELIIQGIENSEVYVEADGEVHVFRQKSGLLSGVPETSLVGARVNTISTDIAVTIINFLAPGSCVAYKVRGDDTALWFQTFAAASLFYLIFSAVGKANALKCRAGKEMEFLRLNFSPAGVTGIMIRAIAGVFQRKPIAEQTPWERCYRARVMLEQLPTVMRRGASERFSRFVHHVAGRICHADGIDIRYLGASRLHGGLGLGEPNGAIFAVVDGSNPVEASAGEWAVARTADKLSAYNVTLEEARSIADGTLREQVWATDSMLVKEAKVRQEVRMVRVFRMPPTPDFPELSDDEAARLARAADFGAARFILLEMEKAKPVASLRRHPVWRLLPPGYLNYVKRVEKRLLLARGDAVDWLAGKLPVNSRACHPELAHFADNHTAAAYSAMRPTRSSRLLIAAIDRVVCARVQERYATWFSW